jgi:hypothetical protein
MKKRSNTLIKNQLFRMALLLILVFLFSGHNLCLADGVDLTKEKSFGVSNHSKLLNKTIAVLDGFLFHRYENTFTKKIDNSETITFTYTAEYKTIDFAKMQEKVISSKVYTGSIPAGKNESFLDLKKLMSDLGVKDYTGIIGVNITDSKGANCVGTGDGIDLRLVKISIDAASQ